MIRPLRKYHFYIWQVLAIMLPIVFVLALAFRPSPLSDNNHMADDFSFGVKKVNDSTTQVNIKVKNPLKVPSCLVYVSSGSTDMLVGKLTYKGFYSFEIPAHDKQRVMIRLYDAIHKKELTAVQLSYKE